MSKGNSGVQRYASNIISNLDSDLEFELMRSNFTGNFGLHFFEQFVIPAKLSRTDLLWTPTHIAPVFHKNSIITVHDLLPIEEPGLFSSSFVLFYRTVLPILLRNARHVFTVSEFTKERVMRIYNVDYEKITVSRNASKFHIDFSYNRLEFDSLVNKYELGSFFLVVGNIGYHKNSFRILDLWNKYFPSEKLVFIGKLPNHLYPHFDFHRAGNVNIVHFSDIKDETLANFYKNARGLIFLSKYEGFGLPLIEANSLGCKVIHSDIQVFNEISNDLNSKVSLISDEDFVNAVTILLGSALSEITRQSLIRASERFNWVSEGEVVSKALKYYI